MYGPLEGVLGDRTELHAAAALADRVVLAPEVGQRDAQQRVELGIVGRGPELVLELRPGRVGVGPGSRAVALKPVRAGERQPPAAAVVVEFGRL